MTMAIINHGALFEILMLSQKGKKWVRYNMKKSFEFIFIIEACGRINIGFSGQRTTWCNHKCIAQKI